MASDLDDGAFAPDGSLLTIVGLVPGPGKLVRRRPGALPLVSGGLTVLAAGHILTRVAVARRALVQLAVLALRSTTPLAVLVVCRNLIVALMRGTPSSVGLRRALWYAVSMWSVVETAFLFYILENVKRLNARTGWRRWQAVAAHSTEEKRRSSMERYLLSLTQVCKGAAAAADSKENCGTPMGADLLSPTSPPSAKSAPPTHVIQRAWSGEVGPSAHFLHPDQAFTLRRSRHARTTSTDDQAGGSFGDLLRGRLGGSFASSGSSLSRSKHDASVNDMLKWMEQEGTASEDGIRRLKWAELAAFFSGPGRGESEDLASWLRRGNLEEWIAHYWFRGSTLEDLEARPKEHQEVQRLADLVLSSAGLSDLRKGRNPHVHTSRILSDPLPVLHRPLCVYLLTSAFLPFVSRQVMLRLGFRSEFVGGLHYWHLLPRSNVVPADHDIAGPRQMPLVFLHGLGVGLVPYWLFLYRLARHHSGELFVPEFPFLAMRPYESVPSAREIVAQLQDMLVASKHTCAHFVGHSFGSLLVTWLLKMSPSIVACVTMMDPAQFLLVKSERIQEVLHGQPRTCFEYFVRYFAFREIFTVNLLCRNLFWEQSILWPEDLKVPAIIELASDDHVVQSLFVRRLLEHERSARKQRRKKSKQSMRGSMNTSRSSLDVRDDPLMQAYMVEETPRMQRQDVASLEILWCEGFIHGEILGRRRASDKLFSKMRQMVKDMHSDD